jgi:hypothetical protein
LRWGNFFLFIYLSKDKRYAEKRKQTKVCLVYNQALNVFLYSSSSSFESMLKLGLKLSKKAKKK